MTLKEIVEQYLKAHGYDGLCHPDGECSCETGDLWPCDNPMDDCFAGVYVECGGEGCEGHGVEHFHIGRKP